MSSIKRVMGHRRRFTRRRGCLGAQAGAQGVRRSRHPMRSENLVARAMVVLLLNRFPYLRRGAAVLCDAPAAYTRPHGPSSAGTAPGGEYKPAPAPVAVHHPRFCALRSVPQGGHLMLLLRRGLCCNMPVAGCSSNLQVGEDRRVTSCSCGSSRAATTGCQSEVHLALVAPT